MTSSDSKPVNAILVNATLEVGMLEVNGNAGKTLSENISFAHGKLTSEIVRGNFVRACVVVVRGCVVVVVDVGVDETDGMWV